MNVQQAKETAGDWIEHTQERYPGLRAAHLVGSITSMAPDAYFPAYKDLDFHLVIEDGSPALIPPGPFPNIIETAHRGVVLEGGLKPTSEYRSVEAVVANPEIAHHLTLDCILYDPHHLLSGLQPGVRREYTRRRWVLERIAYEQRGLDGALQLFPMARQMGQSAEVNILGYTFTFITALMCVATLRPPTSGSRMLYHLGQMLTELGRPDLYEEAVAVLGIDKIQPGQIEEYVEQGAQAFDLAVEYKRSPHPFQHKINPHQRDYFLQSVRTMIDEGLSVHAAGWLTPFYITAHEIMLSDGPEAEKQKYAAQLTQFLFTLGLDTPEKRAAALVHARHVYSECFTLARQIANTYPEV